MFLILALEGCYFSSESVKLVQSLNLPTKIIWINSDTKHQYKSADFHTFPRISFQFVDFHNRPHEILIGGLSDFNKFIDFTKQVMTIQDVTEIMNKFKENNYSLKMLAPFMYLKNKLI